MDSMPRYVADAFVLAREGRKAVVLTPMTYFATADPLK